MHLVHCWFVAVGAGGAAGAESMSVTDCSEVAAGQKAHSPKPQSTGWAGLRQGEGGRKAWGSADEDEQKEEEEKAVRRGEEKGGSRQSCEC